MDTKEQIKQINLADRAVRVLSEGGHFRAVAVKNTMSAKTAQQKHGYSAELALEHAKVLAFSSLLSAFLKGEERIAIDYLSETCKIATLYAEAMPVGEVRGYGMINENGKPGEIDGLLKVFKILYGEKEPVVGIIEAKGKHFDDVFTTYLEQSEQIPSVVKLNSIVDQDGKILQSGGLIVQAMPGATEEEIADVFAKIHAIKPVTDYFLKDMRPDQMLREVLPFKFDVVQSRRIDFFCRCSKKQFLEKLKLVGLDEIREMREQGQNELVCRFCNEKYTIDDADFEAIIVELESKKN